LREFEEIESQAKVEVTVNNKEENSQDFCLDFFQEFGLSKNTGKKGDSKSNSITSQ
jgi:hypothetical protein